MAVGAIAGLPLALVACLLPFALGNLFTAWFILALVAWLIAGFAGAAAARLVTGVENPDELRSARIRQGILAGATAGAVGGLEHPEHEAKEHEPGSKDREFGTDWSHKPH